MSYLTQGATVPAKTRWSLSVPWCHTGQWHRDEVPEKPPSGRGNLSSEEPPTLAFLTTLFVGEAQVIML